MRTRRPPRYVRLANLLKGVAALGIALSFCQAAMTGTVAAEAQPPAEPARPHVKTVPPPVLDRHADDCWTDEAPADVEIPGRVIWQHPDGRTVYSEALVGPALDTVFGLGDLPGHAIAFCR